MGLTKNYVKHLTDLKAKFILFVISLEWGLGTQVNKGMRGGGHLPSPGQNQHPHLKSPFLWKGLDTPLPFLSLAKIDTGFSSMSGFGLFNKY